MFFPLIFLKVCPNVTHRFIPFFPSLECVASGHMMSSPSRLPRKITCERFCGTPKSARIHKSKFDVIFKFFEFCQNHL